MGDGDDISTSLLTHIATTEWASVSEYVLVYSPASDTWDELPPMPMPRAKAASCVLLDGRVALFGGWTQHFHLLVPTSTAIAFDTRHNKWTHLPSLPSEATCIGMCVHHAAFVTSAIATLSHAASMEHLRFCTHLAGALDCAVRQRCTHSYITRRAPGVLLPSKTGPSWSGVQIPINPCTTAATATQTQAPRCMALAGCSTNLPLAGLSSRLALV